jgi:hypothetical protein
MVMKTNLSRSILFRPAVFLILIAISICSAVIPAIQNPQTANAAGPYTFYMDYENGNDSTTATPLGWWSTVVSSPSGSSPAAGETMTGGTSHATANLTIAASTWAGTPTLYFYGKTGTFQPESVTFSGGGSGTISADLTYCAWKTITSGATAARIAPGDTIRIAKSPAPTLVCDATWTNLSKTVTLDAVQTLNIDLCETAWTAGGVGDMASGIARTAVSTDGKEGSYCMKLTPDASPQANVLQAYYTTGALDLHAYQKMSWWLKNEAAIADGVTWFFALCSDNAGATPVDIFQVPAIPSTARWLPLTLARAYSVAFTGGTAAAPAPGTTVTGGSSGSTAIVITSTLSGGTWAGGDAAGTMFVYSRSAAFSAEQVDFGGNHFHIAGDFAQGNLGSSIASIALYSGATAPTASKYLYVDDFIACTTNGLNLQSLISKNSLEQGGDEGWYGIQSINGVTVLLDNDTNTKGNAGRGYYGTTEKVPTYKRETIKTALAASSSDAVQTIQESGSAGLLEFYEGGYDTSTNQQTGETFFDGLNGNGYGLYSSSINYNRTNYINSYRYLRGFYRSGSSGWSIGAYMAGNCTYNGLYEVTSSYANSISILKCYNCGDSGVSFGSNTFQIVGTCVSNSNGIGGIGSGISFNGNGSIINNAIACNNAVNGVSFAGYDCYIRTLTTASNASVALKNTAGNNYIGQASISEGTIANGATANCNSHLFITAADGINHYIYTDGGTIIGQQVTRHTASGIAWKFAPDSTRVSTYPLIMLIAEIFCPANVQTTCSVWVKKDSAANIAASLVIRGCQIAGSTYDNVTTASNTTDWQQLTVGITPTVSGTVQVEADAWYVSGVSYAYFDTTYSVTTRSASSIAQTTADIAGTIVGPHEYTPLLNADHPVTGWGVVYDTDSGAPYANTVSASGVTDNGSFVTQLSSLSPGTLYYYEAYGTNFFGTTYGSESTFLTLPNQPSAFKAVYTDNTSLALSWANGTGSDNTIIIAKQNSYPTSIGDGTQIYSGSGTSTNHSGLSENQTWCYAAYSYRSTGGLTQYSAPVYSLATTYGYNEGYAIGLLAGYPTGYADGYSAGYTDGQAYGESLHVNDYSNGYSAGYADGQVYGEGLHANDYANGYAAGEAAHANDYNDGYAVGYSDGEAAHADDYSNGYSAGYAAGEVAHADDYSDGYAAGYSAGEAAHATDYADGFAAGEAAHAGDYTNGYNAGYADGHALSATTVVTNTASGVGMLAATLNGNITNAGFSNPLVRGFGWGTTSGNYTDNWTETDNFSTGVYNSGALDFDPDTTYYFRAMALNAYGWAYGAEDNFTTDPYTLLPPSSLSATKVSDTLANLSWNKAFGATHTIIRGKFGEVPSSYTDGYLVYDGTGELCTDNSLDSTANTVYYRAWSFDNGTSDYSYNYSDTLIRIGGNSMSNVLLLIGIAIIGLGLMIAGFILKRWYLPVAAAFAWIASAAICFSSATQWNGQWWFGILSVVMILSCIVEPIIMRGAVTTEVGEDEKSRSEFFEELEARRKENSKKIRRSKGDYRDEDDGL